MEEKTKKKRVQKRAVRKKAKTAEPVSAAASPAVTPKTKKPRRSSSKAKSISKTPKLTTLLPTFEQVQLRAYFISERRHKLGLPGDEGHDWLTAERELLAEVKV